MSTDQNPCPKCGGPMAQGFIVDFHQGGSRRVSSWVEGAPQKSFWHGTTAPDLRGVPIGTFRCETCGFLESYARPEFAAS
jgi:uncharacterized protein DUF6487